MREDGDSQWWVVGGGCGRKEEGWKVGRLGGSKESRQLPYSKQRSGRLYFYIKYPCESLLSLSLSLCLFPRLRSALLSRHRQHRRHRSRNHPAAPVPLGAPGAFRHLHQETARR